jgi:formylglycine-generating enzyme required for sulfatase activity
LKISNEHSQEVITAKSFSYDTYTQKNIVYNFFLPFYETWSSPNKEKNRDKNESPEHPVTEFYLGQTLVTQEQWETIGLDRSLLD